MSVTYTATLPVREETARFLTGLLEAERVRRGTRADTRALSCAEQAVVVLRWFLDGTPTAAVGHRQRDRPVDRLRLPARGHRPARGPGADASIGAARGEDGRPQPHQRRRHVDRDRPAPYPWTHPGGDLWWSGKHHNHGGNIQVITAPDGWPVWTSEVRPGREHDTIALRAHGEVRPALAAWTGEDLPVLGDLGYEGEQDTITVAFKKPTGGQLTADQKSHNRTHNSKRAVGERGNSLLKTTFTALRNVSLCPWRIGKIVAAALVLLHIEYNRTT